MPWTPALLGALAAFVTIASFVLLVMGWQAYRREQRGRFLLVSSTFALLFLKGALLTAILLSYVSSVDLRLLTLGSDALILLLLYLSVVR